MYFISCYSVSFHVSLYFSPTSQLSQDSSLVQLFNHLGTHGTTLLDKILVDITETRHLIIYSCFRVCENTSFSDDCILIFADLELCLFWTGGKTRRVLFRDGFGRNRCADKESCRDEECCEFYFRKMERADGFAPMNLQSSCMCPALRHAYKVYAVSLELS
jgi:hypothetical protein